MEVTGDPAKSVVAASSDDHGERHRRWWLAIGTHQPLGIVVGNASYVTAIARECRS